MKKALSSIKLGVGFFLCLIFIGCASTPEKQEGEKATQSSTNLVASISTTNAVTNAISIVAPPNVAASNTVVATTTKVSQPPLKPIEVAKTPPKDNPREWSVDYYENCRTAQIDNTEVYLYKEPQKKGDKGLFPHFIDQTKTVDVIFNSHSSPIVTNRPFRVFIDPGHGGNDPGAVSKDKKTYEKTIALDIAKRLQTYLSGAGFSTMLSRTDNNTTLSLEERSTMANSWGADAFISIHINSSTSTRPNGYETYVLANVGQLSTSMDAASMSGEDWAFVNATYTGNKNDSKNLILGFAIHRRTVKTSRIPDRGLRRARFNVLRQVTMPAVLVECGYLSSPKDLKNLLTADYRERCARGIYQGICDYAYGRMQPGLVATPVPQQNAKPVQLSSRAPVISSQTAPAIVPAYTPLKEKEATVQPVPNKLDEAMKYKPIPQQPIWTPDYTEDETPPSPELCAAREKALKDAGIKFSPKENTPQTQSKK